MHDCTAITALDLILFGAEPQILHAQHRVLIDGWIELRISPRSAVLCKELRKALSTLMTQSFADTFADEDAGGKSKSRRPASASSSLGDQPGILQAIVWLIARGTTTSDGEDSGKGPAGSGKAGVAMGGKAASASGKLAATAKGAASGKGSGRR